MADWNPELYNRFRRYREEPFLAILERLRLRGEESIIDLGCGSGENTVELARRVPRGCAVGIDSSAAMIEAANKVLEGVEGEVRERLNFQLADIATFNSAGEHSREYSVVFSNAALQWVPGHREIFQHILDALTPGGRVVAQMPKNDQETAQITILALAAEPPWKELLAKVTVPSRAASDGFTARGGGLVACDHAAAVSKCASHGQARGFHRRGCAAPHARLRHRGTADFSVPPIVHLG
jgi:trans-aconitate 2-methyltransferase